MIEMLVALAMMLFMVAVITAFVTWLSLPDPSSFDVYAHRSDAEKQWDEENGY